MFNLLSQVKAVSIASCEYDEGRWERASSQRSQHNELDAQITDQEELTYMSKKLLYICYHLPDYWADFSCL